MIEKKDLEKYAQLKKDIQETDAHARALKKVAEEFQSDILDYVKEKGGEGIETSIGTLVLVPKEKHEFPQNVIELMADVEIAQKIAIAKGFTRPIDISYLKFKANK